MYRENRLEARDTLCNTNQMMFLFFQNMSMAFNICLCHDLVRTLKDPFQSGQRRVKFYIMFAFVFSGFFSLVGERKILSKPDK